MTSGPTVVTYYCRSTHHDSPSSPLVAPDCRPTKDGGLVISESGYRKEYLADMEKQRDSSSHTFKKNCKHFVTGYMYTDIEKHFEHILIPPNPPLRTELSTIVRLTVDLRDGDGNSTGNTSDVDISNTPLLRVSDRFRRGFGEALKEYADTMEATANDIRPGKNEGSMYLMGRRVYNQKIILYASTQPRMYKKMENLSERFFNRYGFGNLVVALRKMLLDRKGVGANAQSMVLPGGSARPYTSMIATTKNYGNEDHVDSGDATKAVNIWHESKPPPLDSKDPYKNCKSWYFLFPNMEVKINGEWKKGVAVKLRHGTTISWDARVIRHCTAVPGSRLEPPGNGQVSTLMGTYFGIDRRVVRLMDREALPDGRTVRGKEARNCRISQEQGERLVAKRPVAKRRVTKRPVARRKWPLLS